MGSRNLPALLLLCIAASAQAVVDPTLFGDLRWRSIGPFRGGRVLTVAGVPGDPRHYYFGAVNGGKTGVTMDSRGVGVSVPFPLFSSGPSPAERKRNEKLHAEYLAFLRGQQERILLKRDSIRADSIRADSLRLDSLLKLRR